MTRAAPPPAVPDMQRALRAFARVHAARRRGAAGLPARTGRDGLDEVRALLAADRRAAA